MGNCLDFNCNWINSIPRLEPPENGHNILDHRGNSFPARTRTSDFTAADLLVVDEISSSSGLV